MEKTGCTLGARSLKKVLRDISSVTCPRNNTTVTHLRPKCQRETSLRSKFDKSSCFTVHHVVSEIEVF